MASFRTYRKTDIACSMIETAIDLYIKQGCLFSVMHLAASAQEVLSGLMKSRNPDISTFRESEIQVIGELHKIYGNEKTAKEVGSALNNTRNQTKHHDPKSDPSEIICAIELEAHADLVGAISNYYANTGFLTDAMSNFWGAARK